MDTIYTPGTGTKNLEFEETSLKQGVDIICTH